METPDPPRAAAQAAAETTRTVIQAGVRLYQRISSHIILLFAFFGLLYFLVYFTINSNYARKVFNELVNGKVFRGSITWERISWGPWPSELHIQRPVLADSTGRPVIRTDEVDVSLDLWALTDGAIVGNDIIVDTPIVDFQEVPVEDEWGRPTTALNIAAMFLPPQRKPDEGQPGGPPTLKFRVAEIRNARYQMDLHTIDVDARGAWIEDAYFELRPNAAGAGPPQMRMGAHSVQIRDVHLGLPKTPGTQAVSKRISEEVWRWRPRGVVIRDYNWRDDGFRVESLRARLGPGQQDTVSVKGFELGLAKDREPTISGDLDVDLVDMGPYLAMFGVQGVSGPLAADLRSGGELMSQSGGGTLRGGRLTLPGGAVTGPWALHLRHENNRLDLQRIELETGGGHITGHAFLDGERGRALANLELDSVVPAEVGVPLPESAAADLLAVAVSGPIAAHLTDLWSGVPRLSAEVDLELLTRPEAPVPLPPRTRLTGAAVWQGPRLDVREVALRTDRDELTAAGDLDLLASTARLQFDARLDDVAPFAPLARLPLHGAVRASGTMNGPLARPTARADLRATGLRWDELPAAQLDLTADLTDGRLNLTRLEARSETASVKLKGQADLFRPGRALALAGRVEGFDLPTWLPQLPVTGRVAADLKARGTVADPQLETSLHVTGATFGAFPTAEVQGRVGVRGLTDRSLVLRFDALEVATAKGRVTLDGTFAPLRNLTADWQLGLRDVELAALRPALPFLEPVDGLVSADLTLKGPLRAPEVGGKLDVQRPQYRTLALARLTAQARWAAPHLRVDHLELSEAPPRGGEPHVMVTVEDLSLQVPDLTFQGQVLVDRAPLVLVNHFVTEPLPVRGFASLLIRGQGTPNDPLADGRLTLDDAGYADIAVGDAEIRIEAGNQRVRVDAELMEALQVSASLPTAPGQGAATATVRFTDLSPENRMGRLADLNLRTRLTGTISGGVDLFAPPPLKPFGQVELTDLRVSSGIIEMVNIEPIRVTYREGDLTLHQLGLQAAGQKLRAEGTLKQHQAIEAHLDGDLDLSLLEGPLSATFSAVQGQANIALDVRGTIDNPLPSGRLKLARAVLAPRSGVVGTEIELLEPAEMLIQSTMGPQQSPDPAEQRGNFMVTLPRVVEAPGGPRTNRLVLRRDDGQIRVTALDVELKRFAPDSIAVRLDADSAALHIPDVVRATLDATDLRFSMSHMLQPELTELYLAGHVHLQHALYTADVMGSSEINRDLRARFRGVSQARTVNPFLKHPVLQRFKVNLSVEGENDIFVRNNVALVALDLEIRPSVRIQGNLYDRPDLREDERLKLQGEVSTLPGTSTITYAGKTFDVKTGQVDFGKDSYLDALVVAENDEFDSCDETTTTTSGPELGRGTSKKKDTVTLEIRYALPTLDAKPDPKLKLSSASGASEIDVATMVLTGACPSQLTAASSAQPALAVALNPVLNLVEAPLEQELNIDLDITPTGSALVVEAEKALSKRLRLYSYTPVGEEDTALNREFGLEYQINNFAFGNLSNEGVGQQNSTTGQLILTLDLD